MKKGYLALEITASRIRYVQLERHGRAQQIGCCGDIPHVFNCAAEGALAEAIAAIVAKENIRPERLFVSLCSQENFIRQMIIPRMSAHDLDAAIKGEIEKFPVFTRHAFDYIYYSSFFSRDKNNVVFAAVEDKILKYLFAECQHTGIPFQHLEITPLNFKELLPLFLKDDPDNQVVLIVDDHISYLMIVSGRHYRLIYQSGIGLDVLYPDAKGVISEKNGFSLLGELQRVLKSFLSQNKTEKLKKLWLVWDAKKAPAFDQALTGQLGLDVAPLSLDKVLNMAEGAPEAAMNPIFALVAAPAVIFLRRIKTHFALDHFFRALHIKRYVIKASLVSLAVILVLGGFLGLKTYSYFNKTAEVQTKITETQTQADELKNAAADLYRQRDEYMVVREGLLAQANFVKSLNRVSWTQVLSVMSERMPDKLRLTSFKFNNSGNVSFFGESLAIETVAELLRRVNNSTILQDGKFEFLSEKVFDAKKYEVYPFAPDEFKQGLTPEGLLKAMGTNKSLQLPTDMPALAALNQMLDWPDLYQSLPQRPDLVKGYIEQLEAGETLQPSDLKRVNRLLIEKNYPEVTPKTPKLFSFGIVAQWKIGEETPEKDAQ